MRVIENCIDVIAGPLCEKINQSFTEDVFPNALKTAFMRPIFKRRNSDDLSNYHPISIITNFSKIFEKVLFNRLMNLFRKFLGEKTLSYTGI